MSIDTLLRNSHASTLLFLTLASACEYNTVPLSATGEYLPLAGGGLSGDLNVATDVAVAGSVDVGAGIGVGLGAGTPDPYIYVGEGTASGEYGRVVWDSTSNELRISTQGGGPTQLALANGGNVGIGTGSPRAALHVAGASVLQADGPGRVDVVTVRNGNQSGDEASMVFEGVTDVGAGYRLASVGGFVEDRANAARDGGLVFRTSNNESMTERMRIDSDGKVGIGTTTPDAVATLDVAGDALFGTQARASIGNFGEDAIVGGYDASLRLTTGSPSQARVYIDKTSGNVGIGTTTPVSSLHVLSGYVQLPVNNNAPPASDCTNVNQVGRMVVFASFSAGDDPAAGLYVCFKDSATIRWRKASLQ